jgi:hypothetical protein
MAMISSYLFVTRDTMIKSEQKDISTSRRVARTIRLSLYYSVVGHADNSVR